MRYTGPKWRINRRENSTVLGTTEKWRKRTGLPGQFPVLKKRPSEYSIQFREKQKVKRMYGMTESQFSKFYEKAINSKGNSSLILLQLLETRADNVLFRLGFAQTRAQARQFINHGLVKLNGKKHTIPSTNMKVGDSIEIGEKLSKSPVMSNIKSAVKELPVAKWLKPLENGGTIINLPAREDIDATITERLIIELYSR